MAPFTYVLLMKDQWNPMNAQTIRTNILVAVNVPLVNYGVQKYKLSIEAVWQRGKDT